MLPNSVQWVITAHIHWRDRNTALPAIQEVHWGLSEPESSPNSAQQHLDFLPIQKWSLNGPKVTLDASLKTMNTTLKSKVNKILPILLLFGKIHSIKLTNTVIELKGKGFSLFSDL